MAESFRDELRRNLADAFCTSLENISNFADVFSRANPATLPLSVSPLREAYRLLCNREPPNEPDPPFNGGQCVGICYVVEYQLQLTLISTGSTQTLNQAAFLLGPVGNPRLTDGVSSGFPTWVWNADGIACNGQPGPFVLFQVRKDIYESQGTITQNVTRQDGLPDNCGNPTPIIPPPAPNFNNINIDIVYTNNDGLDVTVPMFFIFARANVNLKGEITVPVRLDFSGGRIQIGGDINLNTGDVNLNFGNSNYNRNGLPNPDGYQPDPSLPDNPDDVPDDVPNPDPSESQPETTRILRACIVTTSVVPANVTKLFQNANPDILIPNLGYVAFAINVNGKIAWTSDIPVKNQRNFIEVPWEGGAVQVRGTPRPGVSWTITPVYALVEDAVTFA